MERSVSKQLALDFQRDSRTEPESQPPALAKVTDLSAVRKSRLEAEERRLVNKIVTRLESVRG